MVTREFGKVSPGLTTPALLCAFSIMLGMHTRPVVDLDRYEHVAGGNMRGLTRLSGALTHLTLGRRASIVRAHTPCIERCGLTWWSIRSKPCQARPCGESYCSGCPASISGMGRYSLGLQLLAGWSSWIIDLSEQSPARSPCHLVVHRFMKPHPSTLSYTFDILNGDAGWPVGWSAI